VHEIRKERERKGLAVKIYETNTSKNKLFYICDDKSCKNTFIDLCKFINDIKLAIEGREDVNNIDCILDEMKKKKSKMNYIEFISRIII